MSAAARARIVEIVGAVAHGDTNLPPVSLVHIGHGPTAPLDEQAGQTGLYELVNDPNAPLAEVALTRCTTPLWEEGWLLRVRFETAGAHSRGQVDALIAAVARAITRALRVASDWVAVLEHLAVRPNETRQEEIPGPEGEPLAIIAELPLRARFYE